MIFKIKTFFLFSILTIFNILINLIFYVVSDLKNISSPADQFIEEMGIFYKILLIGILFPVFEEVVYRLPLHFKKYNKFIYLITIPITILLLFNINTVSLLIISIVIVAYYFGNQYFDLVNFNYSEIVYFIGLSILFTLPHIYNFSGISNFTALLELLFVFLSAVLFGIIRVKSGMAYAIVSHIFFNCFFLSLDYFNVHI